MATVPHQRLIGCDGFKVEEPRGLVGWVEETWLGPDAETAALAVRTLDGRRGLLFIKDVVSVAEDQETVFFEAGARLLELGAPRLDAGEPLHASWTTTGATIDPPEPPGLLRRATLARRPWRLAPPAEPQEPPLWQIALLLYGAIIVAAALFMLAAFAIAAALS
jgi:hypothetical protein